MVAAENLNAVRLMEISVLADVKNCNSILKIKKFMKADGSDIKLKTAAFHSLRRIFTYFIDSERLSRPDGNESFSVYKDWIVKQLDDYKSILYSWLQLGDIGMQIPCVRTIIEFVARDHLISTNMKPVGRGSFGIKTYKYLIRSLLVTQQLDVDTLLMMKEEIFSKADCSYHALSVINTFLRELKAQQGEDGSLSLESTVIGNALDILRILSVPEEVELDSCLCGGEDSQDISGVDELSDESEQEGDEENISGSRKRSGGVASTATTRKKPKMEGPRYLDPRAHKAVFSEAWLALLSLRLTASQHKLVLQHLADHVIAHMRTPLLLADYLTSCFNNGGVLAVLALESLFHLILQHNLDYPHFFPSLYRLCTTNVFGAKYRAKFMKLLHKSLKSTNLPAYMVAAFVKRLMRLALHVASPAASFCVAQATWLLRRHPQCHCLLHKAGEPMLVDPFDASEDVDLEKTCAMQSSLWEAEALRTHHVHGVALLANALRDPSSTIETEGVPPVLEDYFASSYVDLIEKELRPAKRNVSLAFKQPKRLFDESDLVSKCFSTASVCL